MESITPLLPVPLALLESSVRMCQHHMTYITALRDGEFGLAKLALLKFMRLASTSYAICDRLEKENRE